MPFSTVYIHMVCTRRAGPLLSRFFRHKQYGIKNNFNICIIISWGKTIILEKSNLCLVQKECGFCVVSANFSLYSVIVIHSRQERRCLLHFLGIKHSASLAALSSTMKDYPASLDCLCNEKLNRLCCFLYFDF